LTAADALAWVVPSVLGTGGTAVVFALRMMFNSRNKQGERLGRLEKEADERRGFERGFKEGRRTRAGREQ
jgi:hypothetical protein